MTRGIPVLALLAATTALALAACSHATGTGVHAHRTPATAGFGANPADPDATASAATDDTRSGGGTGSGGGDGTGGGYGSGSGGGSDHGTSSPSASSATGPRIVSLSASGAVCPAQGPQYSSPGQVTISWKISGGTGVSLAMDGGLWKSYDGAQGSDTLPFQCPNAGKTNTHRFTVTIKDTNVSKTVSASAPAEPA